MKGFIMSRQFTTGYASVALFLLGLAPFPLLADAPASDVTGNLPTNRILLIGAWRMEETGLKGAILHFTAAGKARIRHKGKTWGEESFVVVGETIATTQER